MSLKFNSKFFIISTFIIINIVGIGFATTQDNYLIQEASAGVSTTGTIEVIKDTVGGDDTFSFSINGGSTTFDIATSSGTGSSGTSSPLATGAYTIEESGIPSGWSLTSIMCTGGGSSTVTGSSIEVDVGDGDSVVCTFENTLTQLWTAAGPGTLVNTNNDLQDDGRAQFEYNNNGAGGPRSDWTYETTSANGADVEVFWHYGGMHAFFQAEVEVRAIVNGAEVALLVDEGPVNCCLEPSNGFGYSGSFSFTGISPGDTYGFKLTGDHSDSTDRLEGKFTTCATEALCDGQLTIEKNTVGGDATFGFTILHNQRPTTIDTFDTASIATSSGTGSDGPFAIADRLIVREDVLPSLDWQLQGIGVNQVNCEFTGTGTTSGNFIFPSTIQPDGAIVFVEIYPGEDVTCAYENVKNGTMIIQKAVVGGDDTFGFTGAGGTTTYQVAQQSPISDNEQISVSLTPGTYTATEGVNSNYVLTDISCDDGASAIASTGDTGTRTATFNVEADETVICTFTNNEKPTVTLEKLITNDDGGDEGAGAFDFYLDGMSWPTGVAMDVDLNDLPLVITEMGPDGYVGTITSPSDPECPIGDVIGVDNAEITTLTWGDHITCYVTNDDVAPTLKLVKTVTDDDGGDEVPDDWTLSATGGDDTSRDFSNLGGSGIAETVLANEEYTLDETTVTGYTEGTWDCEEGNQITLDPGENVVCTIDNDDIAPTITVEKILINTNGGSATLDDFDLAVNGQVLDHGGSTEVLANDGSITVSETEIAGYDLIGITGTKCPTTNGGVLTADLDEDEDITCTFTNQGVGTIQIHKESIGGDDTFDFEITSTGGSDTINEMIATGGSATGPNSDTFLGWGTTHDVIAAQYTITETMNNGIGWTIQSIDCGADEVSENGQSVVIDVNPGDTVDCTFVNKDTLAPVITVPADFRVEDDSLAASNSFSPLSATDLIDPNPTAPTCEVSGPTAVSSPDDIPGIGTHTVTCETFDLAGNTDSDTFDVTLMEVSVLTTSSFKFDHSQFDGSGEVFGAIGTDTVDIVINPGVGETILTNVPVTGDDIDMAGSWSYSSETLPAAFIDVNNIEARLIATNPGIVATSGGDDTFAVLPHAITVEVSTCGGDDTNVKWDHTLCLETTVTDNDFIPSEDSGDLGENAAHEICYSDIGVAGENTQCFTLNPDVNGVSTTGGDDTVQAGIAANVGNGKNVVATFDLNDAVTQYGNSPVTNEDSNNPFALNLEPHAITVEVSTCGGDDTNVKWDHTVCLETTVTDNDFVAGTDSGDLGENAAHEICYSDKGVAGENVQCSTLNPDVNGISTTGGDDTLQAGIADDAGDGINVVATFDLNDAVTQYGNSPVTNEDSNNPFALNLKPHVTTLPLNPFVNTVEENTFTAIGILTDIDRILSDSPKAKVNFDTGNPSFAKSKASTLEDKTIEFAGDTGDPLKQELTNTLTGGITVSGGDSTFDVVKGTNVLKMGQGGLIEVTNVPTVEIDIQNLDSDDYVRFTATAQDGSIFEAIATGTNLDPFPTWGGDDTYGFVTDSDGNQVGDIVKFFDAVNGVDRFYETLIDPNENNIPPTSTVPPILDSDTNWNEITVNPEFVNFLATVANGIKEIKIDEVSRADSENTADISAIRLSEPRGLPEQILETNFDDIAALNPVLLHLRGPTNTNTFGAGTYFGLATTPLGVAEGNEVTASYTPVGTQKAYVGSSSIAQQYSVAAQSWGVGGQEIGIVPDSGTGFTGIKCGADQDNDGVCSSWENTNLIGVNSGFDGLLLNIELDKGSRWYEFPEGHALEEIGQGTRKYSDVYVELDIMDPAWKRLDTNAIADLQKAFRTAAYENAALLTGDQNCDTHPNKCGIRLRVFIDEEIPKTDQLKVWQDFDRNVDDFAHYKSLYFNDNQSRADIGGSQNDVFNYIGRFMEDDDGDGFIDEDPFDGINNDMDCTDGTTIFTNAIHGVDNTDGVPDACFDSNDEIVDDRIFGTVGPIPPNVICSDADGIDVFQLPLGADTDGVIDDCYDENNNLRTAVTELIDEDYVEDRYDWRMDGMTLDTAEDDFFVGMRGKTIIETQAVFTNPTLPKLEVVKAWGPGAGVADNDGIDNDGDSIIDEADEVYRNKVGLMVNSIGEDSSTPGNSFIFRSEQSWDAIDTNTIDESGIDTGLVRVRFDVPAETLGLDGTDFSLVTLTPWRISPDVVTTVDEARAQYFHYGIIADSVGPCGPSGVAELLGNDFIISLGCGFGGVPLSLEGDPNNEDNLPTVGSKQEQANAIMHELGHNFDLLHGGPRLDSLGEKITDAPINCKPNYDSTMSYTHQSSSWLPSNYKPHFSSGKMGPINENALPDENAGMVTSDPALPPLGRWVVFHDGTNMITDQASPNGEENINWNGIDSDSNGVDDDDVNPGAVDVNFVDGLADCQASPGQSYSDHDDWNSLNLIFGGEGVAFDGITACSNCINDFISEYDQIIIDSLDWYDGLIRHNQLSPPNPGIFTGPDPITQAVERGENIDASFQLFTCNPNQPKEGKPDLCRDEDMIVKRLGFYAEPIDPSQQQNVQEPACSGEEGCEKLEFVEGQEFTITLRRVLPLDSPDTTTTEEETFGLEEHDYTFHTHTDGVTSWYHISIDTSDMLLGQYKVIITHIDPASANRELYDNNRSIFNPSTGNFQTASFREYVPSDSMVDDDENGIPDDSGDQVTFLVDIFEVPVL